jgi:FG-GAP-like repeat
MKTVRKIFKLAVPLFVLTFGCVARLAEAQAVSPVPDGSYSGENTTEGDAANGAEALTDNTHGFQRTLPPPPQAPESLLTLNNGTIKVGVDTSYGGAITYLSQSGSTTNLINDYDHGRQVQQSYYSGPANFHPPGTIQNPNWSPFPWNPNQAGDSYDYPSTVLAYSNANGVIYVKTRPKQWALQNYPADCIMEQWTRLDGPAVRVHCKLTNNRSDHTQYLWYAQELPASYGVGTLCRIFSYTGTAPFTGGALTQESATWPPHDWRSTENWSAFVNSSNFGVGVHNPEATNMLGGYLNEGNPCTGEPSDNNTAYIAPTHTEVLDYNIVYEYDFNLIVGTLTAIRSWVYAHRGDPRPDYSFGTSRRHWFPNYGDAGAPSGFLREHLNGPDPQLSDYAGLECNAFAASRCPKIYFAARYVMSSPPVDPHADLYWETNYSGGLSETRKQSVTVVPDGRWRIYSFNVSANAAWSGLISQLRLDPIESGGAGDYVDIAGISYQNAFSSLLPATDLNDDGKPDYVTYNATTRQTRALYLNNNGIIGSAYGPTLPAGWQLVNLADFNGDGHPDYLLFNPTTRQSQIWYLSGVTHTTSANGPTLPNGWQLVATGDFNRDGKPDYVLHNPGTRHTRIWYLNNNVFTGVASGPALPVRYTLAGVADFNRDGHLDYVLFKPGTHQSQIWYLSGAAYVSATNGPTIPSGYQLVGTADFNRNTKPDYLLYNPSTRQTTIWYLNNNVHASSASGPTLDWMEPRRAVSNGK